jgi:hypothetical protein
MTRFYQKFDLIPNLRLRRQLEGLDINKKYRVLITTSLQKELYLIAFHHLFFVSLVHNISLMIL